MRDAVTEISTENSCDTSSVQQIASYGEVEIGWSVAPYQCTSSCYMPLVCKATLTWNTFPSSLRFACRSCQVAAPGFSNHNSGKAVDLGADLTGGRQLKADSGEASITLWRGSWLFQSVTPRRTVFFRTPRSTSPGTGSFGTLRRPRSDLNILSPEFQTRNRRNTGTSTQLFLQGTDIFRIPRFSLNFEAHSLNFTCAGIVWRVFLPQWMS